MALKKILSFFPAVLMCNAAATACVLGSRPDDVSLSMSRQSPQFDLESGRFENIGKVSTTLTGSVGSMVSEYFGGNQVRTPTEPLPQVTPDLPSLTHFAEKPRFIWLGHSSFLLQVGDQTILVDPVLESHASPFPVFAERFQPAVLKPEDMPKIDVILISHDHYDHLEMETMQKFAGTDTKIIVPLGVGSHLRGWGVLPEQIVELDWWEHHEFQGVQYTCTPAQHFSGRGLHRNETLWASWAVSGFNQNVYYSGDSGYGPHFKEIGDRLGPFDLTFIENGQYNKNWRSVHQFPEEAVLAHKDLKGEAMVPVHWGMFELSVHSWYEPVERASQEAERLGVRLLTPKIGELVDLGKQVETSPWWRKMMRLLSTGS